MSGKLKRSNWYTEYEVCGAQLADKYTQHHYYIFLMPSDINSDGDAFMWE